MKLEALLASNCAVEGEKNQAVEVADRDDFGSVQLCHDGRLPLQVLGDVGVVDLVKRHHLWSHLLVQNDVVVVGQEHVSK